MRKKALGTLVLALIVIVVMSAAAWAGSGTWTGATDGVWETDANWNPSDYPGKSGANDTATFNDSGSNLDKITTDATNGPSKLAGIIVNGTDTAMTLTLGRDLTVGGLTMADSTKLTLSGDKTFTYTGFDKLKITGGATFTGTAMNNRKNLSVNKGSKLTLCASGLRTLIGDTVPNSIDLTGNSLALTVALSSGTILEGVGSADAGSGLKPINAVDAAVLTIPSGGLYTIGSTLKSSGAETLILDGKLSVPADNNGKFTIYGKLEAAAEGLTGGPVADLNGAVSAKSINLTGNTGVIMIDNADIALTDAELTDFTLQAPTGYNCTLTVEGVTLSGTSSITGNGQSPINISDLTLKDGTLTLSGNDTIQPITGVSSTTITVNSGATLALGQGSTVAPKLNKSITLSNSGEIQFAKNNTAQTDAISVRALNGSSIRFSDPTAPTLALVLSGESMLNVAYGGGVTWQTGSSITGAGTLDIAGSGVLVGTLSFPAKSTAKISNAPTVKNTGFILASGATLAPSKADGKLELGAVTFASGDSVLDLSDDVVRVLNVASLSADNGFTLSVSKDRLAETGTVILKSAKALSSTLTADKISAPSGVTITISSSDNTILASANNSTPPDDPVKPGSVSYTVETFGPEELIGVSFDQLIIDRATVLINDPELVWGVKNWYMISPDANGDVKTVIDTSVMSDWRLTEPTGSTVKTSTGESFEINAYNDLTALGVYTLTLTGTISADTSIMNLGTFKICTITVIDSTPSPIDPNPEIPSDLPGTPLETQPGDVTGATPQNIPASGSRPAYTELVPSGRISRLVVNFSDNWKDPETGAVFSDRSKLVQAYPTIQAWLVRGSGNRRKFTGPVDVTDAILKDNGFDIVDIFGEDTLDQNRDEITLRLYGIPNRLPSTASLTAANVPTGTLLAAVNYSVNGGVLYGDITTFPSSSGGYVVGEPVTITLVWTHTFAAVAPYNVSVKWPYPETGVQAHNSSNGTYIYTPQKAGTLSLVAIGTYNNLVSEPITATLTITGSSSQAPGGQGSSGSSAGGGGGCMISGLGALAGLALVLPILRRKN